MFIYAAYVRRKFLPKPRDPYGGTKLHFFNLQQYTGLHCKTVDIELMQQALCLFTSHQLLLVCIVPAHGGLARLSSALWSSCHTYRDGLPPLIETDVLPLRQTTTYAA